MWPQGARNRLPAKVDPNYKRLEPGFRPVIWESQIHIQEDPKMRTTRLRQMVLPQPDRHLRYAAARRSQSGRARRRMRRLFVFVVAAVLLMGLAVQGQAAKSRITAIVTPGFTSCSGTSFLVAGSASSSWGRQYRLEVGVKTVTQDGSVDYVHLSGESGQGSLTVNYEAWTGIPSGASISTVAWVYSEKYDRNGKPVWTLVEGPVESASVVPVCGT